MGVRSTARPNPLNTPFTAIWPPLLMPTAPPSLPSGTRLNQVIEVMHDAAAIDEGVIEVMSRSTRGADDLSEVVDARSRACSADVGSVPRSSVTGLMGRFGAVRNA